MFERLMDADAVRNKSMASSEEYNKASTKNPLFGLGAKVKHVIDSMPRFSIIVARKLVDKTIDLCRTSILSSIRKKANQLEDGTVDKIIKFVKTQKKDGLYD